MGCREHHLRRLPGEIGLQPTSGTEAPSITGIHALEAPFRSRRREIVPRRLAELEELLGQETTDAVDSKIVGTGTTTPVPVIARDGIDAASLQFTAENVAVGGVGSSIISGADHRVLSIRSKGCGRASARTSGRTSLLGSLAPGRGRVFCGRDLRQWPGLRTGVQGLLDLIDDRGNDGLHATPQ